MEGKLKLCSTQYKRVPSLANLRPTERKLADLQVDVIRAISEALDEDELEEVLRKALQDIEQRRSKKEAEEKPQLAELVLIHFNDVYNIQAMNGEAGAARFCHSINRFKEGGAEYNGIEPLVLFSGDAFNPSIISVSTRGSQMVPILNALGTHAALYGNHDFDFGIEQLIHLKDQCQFPWILSNVKYIPNGKSPLANAATSHIITTKEGLVIGIIGLIEWAWMATLSTIEEEDLEYEDFVLCAKRMAVELRKDVDMIIALTHMRWGNDERLAREAGEDIDLILGGHDHEYGCKMVNGVYIVKSGTDFREFSTITVSYNCATGVSVDEVERHVVQTEEPEDEEVAKVVSIFEAKVAKDMYKVIGQTSVDLDCRFAKIRTEETNIANFIADIMRHGTRADENGCGVDVAILNAGTLRLDNIIKKGPITLGDLRTLLPMVDGITVLEVTGEQLLGALENGVSKAGEMEGRFPCVSGVRFAFDPEKPPMNRVDRNSVFVQNLPLDLKRVYSLATKTYLANGKDGYEFDKCKVLIDDERCTNLPTLVRNHFLAISVLNGMSQMSTTYGATFMRAVQRFKSLANHQEQHFLIHPMVDGRIQNIRSTSISKEGDIDITF